MVLPNQYAWLLKERGPRILKEAIGLYGVAQSVEFFNNSAILPWAEETITSWGHSGGHLSDLYLSDEIPWCGLFMAVVAKRARKPVIKSPLWALNWGAFGVLSETPMLGDVLVFVLKASEGKKAGHVGLYVGEDDECFHVLGGNKPNCVCIARIEKARLYVARRPKYAKKPKSVRRIFLKPNGVISENEE